MNDRYPVIISPRAEQDLQDSFDWGVKEWGRDEAIQWLKKVRFLMDRNLSFMPLGYGLAPENANYEFELRQMAVRRYRILYTINGESVYVLRVRGPFSGGSLELE